MQSVTHRGAARDQKGFTLIEMMVAISLLAILVSIGVPSFRAFIEANRITAVTNDLVAALQFARSEAIRTGNNMTVCSSNDQSTCSGGWVNGWVVRGPAGVIRAWPAARDGVTIADPGAVVYAPLGNATAARCFQIDLNTRQRFVGVSAGGRVATSTTACP
ncbi:MAG: GspH/FimT family pseudopilin [Pseudomonadota bacterium]